MINSTTQAFLPPNRNIDTAYAFVQDEFTLNERVSLIAGIKAEHNDYTGIEVLLPST